MKMIPLTQLTEALEMIANRLACNGTDESDLIAKAFRDLVEVLNIEE